MSARGTRHERDAGAFRAGLFVFKRERQLWEAGGAGVH
jgi:hypothetical protein